MPPSVKAGLVRRIVWVAGLRAGSAPRPPQPGDKLSTKKIAAGPIHDRATLYLMFIIATCPVRSGEGIGARRLDRFHRLQLHCSTAETAELVTKEAFHRIQPGNEKIARLLSESSSLTKMRRTGNELKVASRRTLACLACFLSQTEMSRTTRRT